MLGWMMLFALMSLLGVGTTLSESVGHKVGQTASFIFAALFFAFLLTSAVRERP